MIPPGIRDDLKRDEGVRRKPYRDSVGKLTIGVGRNLDDVGLSDFEVDMLLDHDIAGAAAELDREAAWWAKLSDGRRRALLNLCFNLGWPKLAGFTRMLAALQAGDFERAAAEALASHWAAQVGERATRVAELIRKG